MTTPRMLSLARCSSALALAAVSASGVAAQSNSFTAGTPMSVSAISPVTATGSTMAGMLVTWTFVGAGGGTFSSAWADLGGGNWGITSGGFTISVAAAGNTFSSVWNVTNATNNRVASIRFNGAPGNTVFDCDFGAGCTPDTPGSNAGRSLFTTGGTYPGGVTGAYTNRVGVGGNPAVGDIYEQLTITFDDLLGAFSRYEFIADTDISVPMNVVPEPGAWALMVTGLSVLGMTSRRRRNRDDGR